MTSLKDNAASPHNDKGNVPAFLIGVETKMSDSNQNTPDTQDDSGSRSPICYPQSEMCGCGRPVRYISASDPSKNACNKYARCPTHDEQREHIQELTAALRELHDFAEPSRHYRDGERSQRAFTNAADLLKKFGG